MSFLTAFTNQLVNLITDLSDIYPDDKEITLIKTSVSLLKMANPRKLLESFVIYIHPYREKINTRDISFFLEHSFNDIGTEYTQDKSFEKVRDKFRQYWSELSEHNKDTIWKYFQVLLVLSDKCNK